MTITLDSAPPTRQLAANATSLTYSFTRAAGAGALYVSVEVAAGSSSPDPTGVTYGGAALAKIASVSTPGGNALSVWRLVTSTVSGAQPVVVACAAPASYVLSTACSFSGAIDPAVNAHPATAAGATSLANTITVGDGSWAVLAGAADNANAAPGAGSTSTTSANPLTCTAGPRSGAGTLTLGITAPAPDGMATLAAEVAPLAAGPPPAYTRYDATTDDGSAAMVLVPAGYSPAAGAHLVLYHHGAGEDQAALLTDSLKSGCVTALLQAGHIVAGTNAAGQNWGSDAGQRAYTSLYAYCVSHWRVRKVVQWSQSMGGLTGLLTLADQRYPVAGWYGIYPVCSLGNLYGNGSATYSAAIRAAYGIASDGSDYAAKTAGHDPLLLAASAYPAVPVRFVASASDATVPKSANSDAMSSLLSGRCPESTVVAHTGDHGDPSAFQPSDLAAFVGRAAAYSPAGGSGLTAAQLLTYVPTKADESVAAKGSLAWLIASLTRTSQATATAPITVLHADTSVWGTMTPTYDAQGVLLGVS